MLCAGVSLGLPDSGLREHWRQFDRERSPPSYTDNPSRLLDHSSQLEQTGNTRSGGGWAGRSVL